MKAKVAISAVLLLLQMASAASDSLPPYTNHTVGGPAGWLFNANSNNPSANYSIWAANQTFNLGDFLGKISLLSPSSSIFDRSNHASSN